MSALLITGGAGFIGSHLTERLLSRGDRVVVVDDFNDHYLPALKRHNLSDVLDDPNFTLVEKDVCDASTLPDVLDSHDISRVIHLAACAGVRASIEQPLLYEEVNVRGTLNVLEACRKADIENLLVASSSSVYGASERLPYFEDDPADRPISPYAATKRSAELLCHTYHHLYDIPITCVRFFTVYGPRQRPDMAFHTFARNIAEGKPIQAFGDGSTRRDYTFVSDIVDGLTAAVDRPQPFETVNFGNTKMVELRRVLEIFQELFDGVKIEYTSEQPGDVKATHSDVSKARRLFEYEPKVDVGEGITRFHEWFVRLRKEGIL